MLDYLSDNLKHHNWWAYRYFFCEFLALINVVGKYSIGVGRIVNITIGVGRIVNITIGVERIVNITIGVVHITPMLGPICKEQYITYDVY